MKVRDAMTGDVLTMTPGRSLRDAAKFMADHNVGAVVIMDPEQPGPGIFTERDLVRSIGKGESPDDEHVSEHLVALGYHERAGHGVRVHRAPPFSNSAGVAASALVGALEATQAATRDRAEW